MSRTSINTKWAGATPTEKRLVSWLALSVFLLVFVSVAWGIQLRPLEPVWGTIADWVAAVATVGGFWAAVHTLRKSAADATARDREALQRERDRQRMEAAKVGVSWEPGARRVMVPPDSETAEFYWSYTVKVLNSGNSPVTHAYIWLHPSVSGSWNREGRNSIQGLDTLLPGAEKTAYFPIDWDSEGVNPDGVALGEMTGFGFRDVHGQCWMNEEGRLIQVRSEEAYGMSGYSEGLLTSGKSPVGGSA